MPIGRIGKKIGMTRIFDEEGRAIPVTVIEAGPCPVLQVKTPETDRYSAIQLGFEEVKARRASAPARGHAAKANAKPHRVVREFRVDQPTEYEVGQHLSVDVFTDGEKVDVIGVTKGRGFQGAIKRHGAHRGAETHGSMYHRRPGSTRARSATAAWAVIA
jgi:large subunit ribosomal protein L3